MNMQDLNLLWSNIQLGYLTEQFCDSEQPSPTLSAPILNGQALQTVLLWFELGHQWICVACYKVMPHRLNTWRNGLQQLNSLG